MEIRETAVERWQRAAQRALAADLHRQLRRRGATVLVPSKTEHGRVYHVRLDGDLVGACDCDAAMHSRPCAHRAAVALRLMERHLGLRLVGLKPAGVRALQHFLRAA